MGDMQHVYATVHGSYNSGPYSGEAAQLGVRLSFVPKLSAPVQGETFTHILNGAAVPDFGTQAGTNGSLTKTWTARIGPAGSTENYNAAFQIAVAEQLRTFVNSLKAYNNSAFRWTHVKQAAIDSLGKTVGTASTYTFTSPIAGSGSSPFPAQLAVAITMRANIVGRSGRGRVYYPALAGALLGTDAALASTAGSTMRTAMKTLIDGIQGIPAVGDLNMPIVCVTSAGKATAVRPVEVRTGQLVDTIKSRRAQATEVYTTLAL